MGPALGPKVEISTTPEAVLNLRAGGIGYQLPRRYDVDKNGQPFSEALSISVSLSLSFGWSTDEKEPLKLGPLEFSQGRRRESFVELE